MSGLGESPLNWFNSRQVHSKNVVFTAFFSLFGCRSPLRRPHPAKSPTNCDAHIAESLFQTHSRIM
ncbi:DUF6783 domain-containing protein [Blautia sp.]